VPDCDSAPNTPILSGSITSEGGPANLSWKAVAGAKKYRVYRAVSNILDRANPPSDSAYYLIAETELTNYSAATPSSYDLWYYKVKAVNDCGESSFSNLCSYSGAWLKAASPIILDINGDGVKATSIAEGKEFDHSGDGTTVASGWVNPYDALLFRDLNGNGIIDSGRELFGNNTILLNGKKAANGFEALAELDTNSDGRVDQIEGADIICVINGNFATLVEAGVKYINTSYVESDQVDKYGNEFRQIGSYIKANGLKAQAADVWFKTE
jgi:hypothetical protein